MNFEEAGKRRKAENKMRVGESRDEDFDEKIGRRMSKEADGKRNQDGSPDWDKLGTSHKDIRKKGKKDY